jgi:hypothetical protein
MAFNFSSSAQISRRPVLHFRELTRQPVDAASESRAWPLTRSYVLVLATADSSNKTSIRVPVGTRSTRLL